MLRTGLLTFLVLMNAFRGVAGEPIIYGKAHVDNLDIFYREAGPKDAPVILLLHGFPSSSRMFDSLLPTLGRRYHLVAPDYPGFGHSDAPDAKSFCVYLDHLALVMEHFTEQLGL